MLFAGLQSPHQPSMQGLCMMPTQTSFNTSMGMGMVPPTSMQIPHTSMGMPATSMGMGKMGGPGMRMMMLPDLQAPNNGYMGMGQQQRGGMHSQSMTLVSTCMPEHLTSHLCYTIECVNIITHNPYISCFNKHHFRMHLSKLVHVSQKYSAVNINSSSV